MGKNNPVRCADTQSGIIRPFFISWIVLLLFYPVGLHCQLSGYMSVTHGYDGNPMWNSFTGSDQVTEGYLQLQYKTEEMNPAFQIQYIGALMRFNALRDRDYYEHALSCTYTLSDDSEQDSSGQYFDFTARATARHDRVIAQDFDNAGLGCTASYKSTLGESISIGLSDDLQYRRYQYVAPLSNIINLLTLEAGNPRNSQFRYGVLLSGGLKYYTDDTYDTTIFENKVTPGKGKGKGLGNQNGTSANSKKTLLTSLKNTSIQIAAGLFVSRSWENASVGGRVLLRNNPRWVTRYLAYETSSTVLSEDIYNDFLSYEGLELRLHSQFGLPLDLRANCALNLEQKKFKVPAMTLDGVEEGSNRKDLRLSFEASLSRNIDLSEVFSIDITLNFHQVRNQSNDEYNDFSGNAVSLSLGVGF
jgi:hypothetical protein